MLTFPSSGVLPPRSHLTRRSLLGGGLSTAALLLAGCGSSDESQAGGRTASLEGDFGRVQVPVDPRRVATTYTDTLDLAVALGLPVVGAPGARGSATNPFPPFLDQAALKDTEKLSTYPDVNVEAIAAVRPDLILDSYGDPDLYERLSGIAPTISIAPSENSLTWQEVIMMIATPLGRTDLAQRAVEARTARAAEVRDAVAAGPYAGAVFAAGYGSPDAFVLYGADIAPCPMLEELGLVLLPSAPQKGAAEATQSVSLELLGLLEPAGAVFVTSNPPDGEFEPDLSAQAGLRAASTWTALPAVRSGSVFDYPVDLVFSGPGSDGALLDLLEEKLTA